MEEKYQLNRVITVTEMDDGIRGQVISHAKYIMVTELVGLMDWETSYRIRFEKSYHTTDREINGRMHEYVTIRLHIEAENPLPDIGPIKEATDE